MKNQNRKITMTVKEVRQMKARAKEEGVKEAMVRLSLFPLLALRDLENYGQKRMLRYIDKYNDISDSYIKGYISFLDVVEILEEEVKIDLKKFMPDERW